MKFFRCLFVLAAASPVWIFSQDSPPPYSFLNRSEEPNRWSFFVAGQYLYQKAESEGFDIAYAHNEFAISNNSFSSDGQIIRAELPWKNSARVLAGFAYNQWDLIGSWTFYRGEGAKNIESDIVDASAIDGPIGRFVDPTWLNFMNDTIDRYYTFSSFSSSYDLCYDCADLSAGKSIYFNPHFFMRPSFGLRAARIDHSLSLSGVNEVFAPTDPLPFFLEESVKNRFRGIGMRAAVEARYALNRYFSFYSEFIGALLFGGQKGGIFIYTNTGSMGEDQFFTSDSPMYRFAILPSWQADLGVKFSYPVQRSAALFELGVGYELTYWPHQWFVSRMYPELNEFRQPGDVSFRALVVEGTFAY
jgi:hypothetical protein